MKLDLDTCEEILLTITRNKTRSLLTAFGIFWGIFMLIALMGGGHAMQEKMQQQFAGFATNSGFIAAMPTGEPYRGFRKGRHWDLELADIERLREGVPGLDVVTPNTSRWNSKVVFEDKEASCSVKGNMADYVHIETPVMLYGRYLNDIDVRESRKVCVIGKRIYENLFHADEDPCGRSICIDGVYYRVIGVCASSGKINIQGSAEESVILPFTTMQHTYNLGNKIQIICYTARPGYRVSDLEPEIGRILKAAHYIAPDDRQALMLLNAEAVFTTVDNLFLGIHILIWMVGLGTLLAGAIGVSNIMMVTVRERTTEIGIRRAIGARPRDILEQILTESLVLTTLAGLAGLTFGVVVLQLAEMGVNGESLPNEYVHFQVSFGAAVGMCLLLAVLGTLAGLAPAYRAMAVKPIDAIREE